MPRRKPLSLSEWDWHAIAFCLDFVIQANRRGHVARYQHLLETIGSGGKHAIDRGVAKVSDPPDKEAENG